MLERVLHIGDVHSPDHDRLAFDLMLDVAEDLEPDTVIVYGDFFDTYSVSRHLKNPEKDFNLIVDEIKEAKEALELLTSTIQPKRWIMLEGNHEKRVASYIATHAPKLHGLVSLRDLFGIPKRWTYIPYGNTNYFKLPGLICTHGSRAGENPAASMVKKFRSSVSFGHTHRLQEYHINDIHGADWVGLNVGWLGDQLKAAEYIQDVSDWTQGFMVSYHTKLDFYYQLVRILTGPKGKSCHFEGVIYKK